MTERSARRPGCRLSGYSSSATRSSLGTSESPSYQNSYRMPTNNILVRFCVIQSFVTSITTPTFCSWNLESGRISCTMIPNRETPENVSCQIQSGAVAHQTGRPTCMCGWLPPCASPSPMTEQAEEKRISLGFIKKEGGGGDERTWTWTRGYSYGWAMGVGGEYGEYQ